MTVSTRQEATPSIGGTGGDRWRAFGAVLQCGRSNTGDTDDGWERKYLQASSL